MLFRLAVDMARRQNTRRRHKENSPPLCTKKCCLCLTLYPVLLVYKIYKWKYFNKRMLKPKSIFLFYLLTSYDRNILNDIVLCCVWAGRYLSCWYETRSYHNWLLFELWGLRELQSVRIGCYDGRLRLSDAGVTAVHDSPSASSGPPLPKRLSIKKL